MKGDFTRWTYSPTKNYSSVLQQQGRVLLDADWNEQREIDLAGRRTLARDLIGDAAGPLDAMGYTVVDEVGQLKLLAGRYYVDGILCELHEDTPINAQPDLPEVDPTANLAAGRYAVYLDVWERHVTHIEDPNIKEKALGGPDHTTRSQVVAQARLVAIHRRRADECEVLHDLDQLAELIEGTRGRMLASVDPTPPAVDPCIVPASARYRGLENQLYRVEIHQGGKFKDATFKWSRDNGSVVTAWDGYPSPIGEPKLIEVADLGPDQERTFNSSGLLVELLDDTHELAQVPGQLVLVDKADEASRTITLQGQMVTAGGGVVALAISRGADEHHPRVRRWDGSLRKVNEIDVTDSGRDWIELGQGVRVSFQLDGSETFRTGDYWLIPARTVDGTITWVPDELQLRHGPSHRYACLSVVEFDGSTWKVIEQCQRWFPSLDELIHLRYVGGDGQQGVLGATLPAPLRVQVLNGGVPVEGAQVRFEIQDPVGNGELVGGSGTTQNRVVDTDDKGLASVGWQLADESAWALDPTLIDQSVQATLLDECGEPTEQIIVFSAHESQAVEVRFDNSLSVAPGMSELHTSGYETDHVQRALEVLCQNPHLSYVGGDGQEAMPGDPLANKLVVRVGNGAFAFAGVDVEFTLIDLTDGSDADAFSWAGSLGPFAPGSTPLEDWGVPPDPWKVSVKTDADGYAWIRWTLGVTPGLQRPGVRAQIIRTEPFVRLDENAAVVLFAGRWSLASQIAYDPKCHSRSSIATVGDALDSLYCDHTLYYVTGTGQGTNYGGTLPVPLTVRVANEGQPIVGAKVRFKIVDSARGPITEATAGTLAVGGASGVVVEVWPPGDRSIIATTGSDGLAWVQWTYGASASDITPMVEAVLLDAVDNDTTSVIRFTAVIAGGLAADQGIHIMGTVARDLAGARHRLDNDNTIDPWDLLGGIGVRCSRTPDPATIEGKRTVHVRIQVPYGWNSGILPDKADDIGPDFAPEGVQHYDEHVVAGSASASNSFITWTPTTAARRMLVHVGRGPLTAWKDQTGFSGLAIPHVDWPLPVRLALFGGGEWMVRTCLTVEGDFVHDKNQTLHVDGETLGKLSGSRLALDFPSGDGRAGGDFRTWFWLDMRRRWPFNLFFEIAPKGEHAIVVTPRADPDFPKELGLGAAWIAEERLVVAWADTETEQYRVVRELNAGPQHPGGWLRSTTKGQPDGASFGFVRKSGGVAVLRVGRSGEPVLEQQFGGLKPPAAANGPRGIEIGNGQALAWVGIDGGLYALLEVKKKWSLHDLRELLGGTNLLNELVDGLDKILDRGIPGNSHERLALEFGERMGLDSGRIERLTNSLSELVSLPSRPKRAKIERTLKPHFVNVGFEFVGHPVVWREETVLHVFCLAMRFRGMALLKFEWVAKGGKWRSEQLSDSLKDWEPPGSDRIVGSAGRDKDGKVVEALAWVSENGQIYVARKRGTDPWSLEQLPQLEGVSPEIAAVVDQVGMIHVIALDNNGQIWDLWSDHRTPWTSTNVSERVHLGVTQPPLCAARSADGMHMVLTGPAPNDLRLRSVWFGGHAR